MGDETLDSLEAADSVDENRLDDARVERALIDLDDDAARTGALCSEGDLHLAAERNGLSIVEFAALQERARARHLLHQTEGPPDLERDPDLRAKVEEGERESSDSLEVFFRQLDQFPLLNPADEIALARAIQNGLRAQALLSERPDHASQTTLRRAVEQGTSAKQRMVASNVRLAIANAKQFRNQGLDFPDLIQAAIPGLIRAAEKFDHQKGFKFSTYATWWIRQSIARALADTGRIIRLPVHIVERVNKFRRTRYGLVNRLGREPTTDELAAALEWEPAEVVGLIESVPTVISLDAPVSTDPDSASLSDLIASNDPSPYDEVARSIQGEIVDQLLATLDDRERLILELRYGLGGNRPHTLDEAGQLLSITRERVRQIERRALEKLEAVGSEIGILE